MHIIQQSQYALGKNSMKVNVVTSSISRNAGGLFVSVRHLSQEIDRKTDGVTIHGLDDRYAAEDTSDWKPLIPNIHKVKGLKSWGYSKELKDSLVSSEADIYHVHGIWMYPSVVTGAIARRKGKPYVVSPRGMLDPWALKNSAWKKKIVGWLLENRNLRAVSCINALCESEYQSIRAYGLKNPVAIIPNGIDLPEIEEVLPSPWQEQIAKGKKVMLFVGRIHPKKGLPNLIKAWAKTKLAGWALAIAGWDQGGHEDELKRMVAELGFEKDIIFLGPVFDDKKQACLQNADAFILPSFSEGLPMSVLEAWAYSLPVIKTLQCNIPQGFAAKAAIEIGPEVDSISDGVNKFVMLSESQQNQIGQNGLHLVKDQFTWPRIASQMIDVYRWILGQGDKPDCVRID